MATNTPVQGAAADMIKVSMIKIEKRLRDREMAAVMILQIHDELIFEVPTSEVAELEALVREEMEGVIDLKVPIIVNITIGDDWRKSS
jgi:DNA polymerase-1